MCCPARAVAARPGARSGLPPITTKIDTLPQATGVPALVDHVEGFELCLQILDRQGRFTVRLAPPLVAMKQSRAGSQSALFDNEFLGEEPANVVGLLFPDLVGTHSRRRRLQPLGLPLQ